MATFTLLRLLCSATMLGSCMCVTSPTVPSGWVCGSSSSRGSPPDWVLRACGSAQQSVTSSVATCTQDSSCKGFNLDTSAAGQHTPCWRTSADAEPDNVGDLSGRWIQCKPKPEFSYVMNFSTMEHGMTVQTRHNMLFVMLVLAADAHCCNISKWTARFSELYPPPAPCCADTVCGS